MKVRMVTGDSIHTAKAIAQECHILTRTNTTFKGSDIQDPNLEREDMDRLLSTLQVLAESSPSDKLRLVKELTEHGEVVAVTGDGTKDCSALKEAYAGLAMGVSGKRSAKQSSDVVILDDDFASIVSVAPWGRAVYANSQKVNQFQLTLTYTILVFFLIALMTSGNSPFSILQVLWVDLIVDTFGALALANEEPAEEPAKDLMLTAPTETKAPLVTKVTWINVFVQSLYQTAAALTIYYAGERISQIRDKDKGRS